MNGIINENQVINWSEKVKNLDNNIRKEIGIEGESEAKHILIKVQTKAAECIEPAFIVAEDDTFLDLFVLSPQGAGITSTADIVQWRFSRNQNILLKVQRSNCTYKRLYYNSKRKKSFL